MKSASFLRTLAVVSGLFIILNSSAFGQAYVAAVLGDGPQAYYRFEESSGASSFLDSSGNNFHGQAANAVQGVTFGESGQVGQAARFDGAGSLLTGFNLNPAAGAFTLEALVYNFAPDINQIYFAQQDGGGLGRSDFLINATGFFGSFLGGSTTSSTVTPEANRWYHIAMTYNGTGGADAIGFYVNGLAAGTGTETAESAAGNWVLGSHKNRTSQFANGYIDEATIYDYALSPEQIAAHFAAVPEPSTWALLTMGTLAGLTLFRRRG